MFVVATAIKSAIETTWELHSIGENKPTKETVQYYRGVFGSRSRKVRVFTEAQWDALPNGERSDDWTVIDNKRFPSYPQRVPA